MLLYLNTYHMALHHFAQTTTLAALALTGPPLVWRDLM